MPSKEKREKTREGPHSSPSENTAASAAAAREVKIISNSVRIFTNQKGKTEGSDKERKEDPPQPWPGLSSSPAHTTKSCWPHPWAGHTPGLWVQSPAGTCPGGNGSMFLSHSLTFFFSLPFFLSLSFLSFLSLFLFSFFLPFLSLSLSPHPSSLPPINKEILNEEFFFFKWKPS